VFGYTYHTSSSGWFDYYVLRIPRAHGILWALAPDVASHDVLGVVLVVATLAMTVVAARAVQARGDAKTIVFGAMLFAGFAAAVSSRLHIGGWINVLQPWTTFASIALAVFASRLESRAPIFAIGAGASIVLQCALFGYDPRLFVPRSGMANATARFHARVHELEERGEVLLVSQGHVTRQRHFQMSGLADVVRVDGHSPADLVAALRTRTYAAVLDDARIEGDTPPVLWPPVMLEDVADLRAPLFESYFVGERLDDSLVALPMAAPAMPRWILYPRQVPLEAVPRADLDRRHFAEMHLAERRSNAIRDGKMAPFTIEEIESLARNPDSAP
jgi:hypothetical protein